MKSSNPFLKDLPEGYSKALSDAVRTYQLPETDDWQQVEVLAPRVDFSYLDVNTDITVPRKEGGFEASGAVDVELIYEETEEGDITLRESFPVTIRFDMEPGPEDYPKVEIREVAINTKSFYR